MAIDTKIHIIDRDGDAADTRKVTILRRPYDKTAQHPSFSLAANTKTDVDLGSIATLQYVCIVAEAEIQVFKNNSPESWSGTHFLVIGCDLTRLSLQAATATTVYIYLAGA